MNTAAATQAGDLPASEDHNNCRALGQILDRIGDKWTIMVVGVLSRGTVALQPDDARDRRRVSPDADPHSPQS